MQLEVRRLGLAGSPVEYQETWELQREMHEAIAGSELELLSHCGHWPQHEQAGIYNKLSLTFLQRHSASNTSK